MVDDTTLQMLADRAAIADGLAAYCRHADDNEPERQAALFTEDCLVSYGEQANIRGRPELADLLRGALARYTATSHVLGGVEIVLDGDRASVTSAVQAWHRNPDGSSWTLFGRYVDTWQRTPDGWRITERQVQASGAEGRSLDRMHRTPRRNPGPREGLT